MPSEYSTNNTPLAPSVEKAYYRKCIALKRRLNEIEEANDQLKVNRARLDRSIMKMRLERAFLLDQIAKRMEYNVDGSEGSNDEIVATPPPDRPHRDKRRRAAPSTPSQQNPANARDILPSSQPPESTHHRTSNTNPEVVSPRDGDNTANGQADDAEEGIKAVQRQSVVHNNTHQQEASSAGRMEGVEHHGRNGDGPSRADAESSRPAAGQDGKEEGRQ